MKEDIVNILEYNLLSELKRKELTKEQRSVLLQDYMKRNNKSIRQLATEFNVPHTTLFYWANDDKRVEHIQSINGAKAHKELDFLIESLSLLLNRIEGHKIKIKEEDRLAIEKIKDISHKIYLMTRVVKI